MYVHIQFLHKARFMRGFFLQEYEEQLTSGAVAYINLDAAVRGLQCFFLALCACVCAHACTFVCLDSCFIYAYNKCMYKYYLETVWIRWACMHI